MTKILTKPRGSILAACALVLLLATAALAVSVGQRLRSAERKEKGEALEQVKQAPEQPLRILGNDDCPLRIIEAKVKEVPGHIFTKMTGRVTNLAAVSSYPEATLLNTSGQTVTKFFLVVRDPKTQYTQGLMQGSLAIKPGEAHVVKREYFITPEKVTVADKDGVRQKTVMPGIDSEKSWMQFAARADLYVTVGKVEFEDGSSWTIKEGGEVK